MNRTNSEGGDATKHVPDFGSRADTTGYAWICSPKALLLRTANRAA
jgi:hypothetical protein